VLQISHKRLKIRP